MLNERASGILLHPTSLPGSYGSGDFGLDAFLFVDWLVKAGQTYWQVLPLGEIGPGNSPYMGCSAFAGNILLIDLVELFDHGWTQQGDLQPHPGFQPDKVDFVHLKQFRIDHLRLAAKGFFASDHDEMHRLFTEFCIVESDWLDDYAMFMTIAEQEGSSQWNRWSKSLARRDEFALKKIEKNHSEEIHFWKFCQWCFDRQWSKLRLYAGERGVKIIGDVPIFVAFQSVDVWSHQELFDLDKDGNPICVAGVPPDYFSATGQLWGNPLYKWDVHEKTGFSWWIARIRHALQQADLVRIDHFRGFAAYWEIPADAPNAISGKWVTGPGEKLFYAFQKSFPYLPIIAEDLGVITPDVIALRDKFNLPGMRVLQFAFGDGEDNPFLPHNYIPNTVAYTGTHDNDTILGWWQNLSEHERSFAKHYLKTDGQQIQWDMMRAISSSQANLTILSMQDVLGLDGNHRMNFPGQSTGSWEWRFSWDQVNPVATEKLEQMSKENFRHSSNSFRE